MADCEHDHLPFTYIHNQVTTAITCSSDRSRVKCLESVF